MTTRHDASLALWGGMSAAQADADQRFAEVTATGEPVAAERERRPAARKLRPRRAPTPPTTGRSLGTDAFECPCAACRSHDR